MSACVFLGPTLRADDARAICPDVLCLPPVRQGDVYRVATSLQPDAIGIIDGYFSHVPSVWHKEILYAMSQGIPVYGSASMGALRAAELAQFGMRGVGRIFEAYREGVLEPFDEPFEDDDEVAVLHGPEELGYLALSDAMVNIRCTLARAAEERIIDPGGRDTLVGEGKAIFYQQRSYDAILSRAAGQVLPQALERFRAWLPDHKVDQKRADAIAMLHVLREARTAETSGHYRLAETTLWEQAKAAVNGASAPRAPELDELRLQGPSYLAARAQALDRLLDPDGLERGRACGAADARWRELVAEQVPLALLERHILAELRAGGEDRVLRRRAEEKRQMLARLPLQRPVATDWLVTWYFKRLGTEVPGDCEAYARSLDFVTADAFHRSLLDEYLFLTLPDATGDPGGDDSCAADRREHRDVD